MCSASFSSVGLSDEFGGRLRGEGRERLAHGEARAARQSREPRLKGLRIEFLIGTFAGAGDLRQHLHDALQFVLVQRHQAGFDGHGAGACSC